MKIVRYISLVVLTALLLWGVIWARGKAGDEVCRKVVVQIINDDSIAFVNSRGIIEELKNAHIQLKGRPMWQINSDKIERMLSKSQYLESVDCIKAQDGYFVIRVKQLVPVMRVFDGDDSYYVNRDGKRMDASSNYFSDVPIVNGHFSKVYNPVKLLPMIHYVQRDSLLNTIVTMYEFRGPQDIFIVPCFYGHIVNMGSVDNYESKFRKLLLFYRKVMPVRGWNTYDTISVKWNHQIVASRRNMKVEQVMAYDPEDDEIAPDLETMTTTADNRPDAIVSKNMKSREGDRNATHRREEAKKEEAKKETPKKADDKNVKTGDSRSKKDTENKMESQPGGSKKKAKEVTSTKKKK